MKNKARVIVVEDHELLRSFLKTLVEGMENCQVVAEAACGLDALNTIRTVPADLVLLDLSLPRLDGLTLLKEIRKIPIKTLVLTMHKDENVLHQALENGADGFCLKDMDLKLIERAISETLEGKIPIYLEK